MKRKILQGIALVVAVVLVLSGAGCASDWGPVANYKPPTGQHITGVDTGHIRAAVVYAPDASDTWKDILSYLDQSVMIGLEAEAVMAGADYDDYHLLYLDRSLASLSQDQVESIAEFVFNGGSVVVDNALWSLFSCDFFGAEEFVPLEVCPVDFEIPNVGKDLGEIQTILADFAALYQKYADYAEILSDCDYGYAMVCDTAMPLIVKDGLGLYTVNNYGQGSVFFCNSLCPNFYNASGFAMDSDEGQLNFASTTASTNQLLMSAFAQYLSKQYYGFTMSRVFGTNGAPAMAWELHYEEITGIENGSMQLFDQLCREYNQIPSYTFIRNTYEWLLRAESVSYYINEGGGQRLRCTI